MLTIWSTWEYNFSVFKIYFAEESSSSSKARGHLPSIPDGKTTDYLKENFCDSANTKYIVPEPGFEKNNIYSAGWPGVFDIMIDDTDQCREKPKLVNGIECRGNVVTFVLCLGFDEVLDVYIISDRFPRIRRRRRKRNTPYRSPGVLDI